MELDTSLEREREQLLLGIVRALPPERVEQLVDFARFLEAQILSEELAKDETISEVEADNARWDALLETEEGQAVLENLAAEALSEHRAGKTKKMHINDEGRLEAE